MDAWKGAMVRALKLVLDGINLLPTTVYTDRLHSVCDREPVDMLDDKYLDPGVALTKRVCAYRRVIVDESYP